MAPGWGRGCLVPPGSEQGQALAVGAMKGQEQGKFLERIRASSAQSKLSAGLAQLWALQYSGGLHFDFLLFLTGLLLLLAQLLAAGGAISAGKCSMSVPLS